MKQIKYITMASVIPALLVTGISEAQAKCLPNDEQQQRAGNFSARLMKPVDDNCNGGGNNGPTNTPSTPASISVTPYTNEGTLTIKWEASSRAASYDLYEKIDDGSWNKIYSGRNINRLLTDKNKGIYQYRVQAKNSKGKSPFRTSSKSVVNKTEEIDLYTIYPGTFEVLDQNISKYKATESGIKTTSSENKNGDGDTDVFYLGNGFDLIKLKFHAFKHKQSLINRNISIA